MQDFCKHSEQARILKEIQSITSDRKPRRVVIPTGKRPRGRFPSLKSNQTASRFESLLEESMLRIAEVSTVVEHLSTHPFVLTLDTRESSFHYTPDLFLQLTEVPWAVIVEVKGCPYLRKPSQQERLRQISGSLLEREIPYLVLLSSDITASMDFALKDVLSSRPWPRFGTRGAPVELEVWQRQSAAWKTGQEECDALIRRLLRRPVEATLQAAATANAREVV